MNIKFLKIYYSFKSFYFSFRPGSIKTPNSIEAAGKFFKAEIKTGDAVDTAYAIMSGVTQRYRDVYHPWLMLKMCAMFRDWFPNTVDYLVRLSVKED